MLNRWAARPRARWLIGAAAVVLALVIIWALLVPGADWLARHDIGSAKGSLAAARDAARGRLLTLGAGLLAAGALLFTARNFTLSREGQVTDRYTKAIEQLGSDKLDVRIGGIYALERVARDSAKDHPTIMEVLTAFIREHSREPWPVDSAGQQGEKKTRPDVQAAVTVAGRRDAKRDILPIDFAGANLARANLAARTSPADLAGADLTGANLDRRGPRRREPRRREPRRRGPHRRGPHRLANAKLGATPARTSPARTSPARTSTARNSTARTSPGAYLAFANLAFANLTGANLTDARWSTAVPVPDGWMVGSESGRLKRAGQLSEVGSGAGAVALSGVRSRSHFSPGFPCGPLHCVTMAGCSVSSPRRIEPCVRFSRTRLTDAVHRRHSA